MLTKRLENEINMACFVGVARIFGNEHWAKVSSIANTVYEIMLEESIYLALAERTLRYQARIAKTHIGEAPPDKVEELIELMSKVCSDITRQLPETMSDLPVAKNLDDGGCVWGGASVTTNPQLNAVTTAATVEHLSSVSKTGLDELGSEAASALRVHDEPTMFAVVDGNLTEFPAPLPLAPLLARRLKAKQDGVYYVDFEEFAKAKMPYADLTRDPKDNTRYLDQNTEAMKGGFDHAFSVQLSLLKEVTGTKGPYFIGACEKTGIVLSKRPILHKKIDIATAEKDRLTVVHNKRFLVFAPIR